MKYDIINTLFHAHIERMLWLEDIEIQMQISK